MPGDRRGTQWPPLPPAIALPGGTNNQTFHHRTPQGANFERRTPVPMEIDAPFDPAALGLKEIGNLASWTVSSCKPTCGVDALRDDDTALFWQ